MEFGNFQTPEDQILDPNIFCAYCLQNDKMYIMQWGYNTNTGKFDENVRAYCTRCNYGWNFKAELKIEDVTIIKKKLRFKRIA